MGFTFLLEMLKHLLILGLRQLHLFTKKKIHLFMIKYVKPFHVLSVVTQFFFLLFINLSEQMDIVLINLFHFEL